jgi:hypothetical protein
MTSRGTPSKTRLSRQRRRAYRSEVAARAVAQKHPIGDKIKVRVDRDDVMTTVLEPGTGSARRRMIIGLMTLAAPVVVGALLTSIGQ